jgi:Sap, sulfolipid-1-addressing protein
MPPARRSTRRAGLVNHPVGMTPGRGPATKLPRLDLGSLILLALAASVYPTLLAGVILILSQPRPLRTLLAFLVGGVTISVVAGILIVNAIEASGAVGRSNHTTRPIVAIVLGVLSLLVAMGLRSGRIERARDRRAQRKPKPDRSAKPSLSSRALSGGSVTMAFVAGLLLNLPGVWYLEALTEIAHADPSTASALLQILLFNVIMFMLVELPIVAYLINPRGAAQAVNNASGWAHRHAQEIGIALATGVGAWLIVKGIIGLVS